MDKKGKIKIALFSFVFITIISVVAYAVFVLAGTHTADVTLGPSPLKFSCDSDVEFTLTVKHTSGDPIKEVRIYNDPFEGLHTNIPPHENFECGSAPDGWVLVDQHLFGFPYCQYQARSGNTLSGTSKDFTFSATLTTESNYAWGVETYDITNSFLTFDKGITVDCTAPTTEKHFEPEGTFKIDPQTRVEWIDGTTKIVLDAVDDKVHNSGVDETFWRNTLVPDDYCWDVAKCMPCEYTLDGSCDDFQKYTGPITKDEESCHLLEFYSTDKVGYSTDKVGNVEDVNTNCFFVDKTPPITKKTVGTPEITDDGIDVSYSLTTTGDATAEISEEESYEGDDSIKLYANLITSFPPSNEGRVYIPVDSFRLRDIYTIEWYTYVTKGYIPHVDIILDFNEDGIRDNALVVEYDKVDSPSDQLLGDMGFDREEWVNTFDDKGIVDSDAKMWLSSGAPGPVGGLGFIYGSLADWKAGTVYPSIDGNTKVIALEIEVDGWIAESEAFVDAIKLNGLNMQISHLVTSDTDITFTCTDQEPHPSGMEELCFKVSYDKEPLGLTSLYATKYHTQVGDDGFACVPVNEDNKEFKEFIFNFNEGEDSVHDLVYYCKDAVEKKSPTQLQWYKVDDTHPEIIKTVGEPHVGDCSQDGQGPCYVQDHVTPITIDVEDAGIHKTGIDRCEWSYSISETRFESQTTRETEFPFVIIFPEDSTHILNVTCFDRLGNPVEDVETFLVDSEPPETKKEYSKNISDMFPIPSLDGPVPVNVDFISIDTEITLTPHDDKVDNSETFYIIKVPCDPRVNPLCQVEWVGVYDYNIYHDYNECLEYNLNLGEQVEVCKPTYWRIKSELLNQASATNDPLTWPQYIVPFTIPQESIHKICFYSVDELGNTEEIKCQVAIVDNTPPRILSKTIVGPSHGQCPPRPDSSDICFIDGVTKIQVDVADQEPHPVGGVTCDWDYEVIDGDKLGSGQQGVVPPLVINFSEESEHRLTITCRDALGNTKIDTETFVVDKTPPAIDKRFEGPYFPQLTEGGLEWISSQTKIIPIITDAGEHKSGIKEVLYRTTLVNDEACRSTQICQGTQTQGTGNFIPLSQSQSSFSIAQESCHLIEIKATDNVNKTTLHKQCVFVDNSGPDVEKLVGEPKVPCTKLGQQDCDYYITQQTPIHLSCLDPEPHPVNHNVLFWRDYLEGTIAPEFKEEPLGAATIYKTEDSRHILEAFCVDALRNQGPAHRQILIVDSQPPTPVKEVGVPKTKWNPTNDPLDPDATHFYPEIVDLCWNTEDPEDCKNDPNCLECWKVTLLTDISLMCEDLGQHPVNHETVCFNVEVDGEDATDEYCENDLNKDGFCCVKSELPTFHFAEVSEHNLKFYCEDALENSNKLEIDEEKFKVEETTFSIWINKKWNLISVPVKLLDDSMDLVFDDISDEVESVWQFDGENWHVYTPDGNPLNDDVTTMEPGWGYWILANDDAELLIGGSLMSPAQTPPSKPVVAGWNLFGYYGADSQTQYHGPVGNGKEASCVFNTLGIEIFDKAFTSLWTYWEPHNPNQWKPLGKFDNLDPGAGYWLFAQEDGIYAPSTTCGDFFP